MKKTLAFGINCVLDVILGCFSIYLSVISSENYWIFFSLIAAYYFWDAYRRISFLIAFRRRKTESVLHHGLSKESVRRILQYEDRGQDYEYVVEFNEKRIVCYSNEFLGPESPLNLISLLEIDGKISANRSSVIRVKVNIRKGGERAS